MRKKRGGWDSLSKTIPSSSLPIPPFDLDDVKIRTMWEGREQLKMREAKGRGARSERYGTKRGTEIFPLRSHAAPGCVPEHPPLRRCAIYARVGICFTGAPTQEEKSTYDQGSNAAPLQQEGGRGVLMLALCVATHGEPQRSSPRRKCYALGRGQRGRQGVGVR